MHNEALQLLDVLAAAAVEEPPLASPPGAPATGSCYLVKASPTGDWIGHAHQLAAYTSGGWRFIAPSDGMTALVKSIATTALYRSGAWEIGKLRGSEVVIGGQKVVGGAAPRWPSRPAGRRSMPRPERRSAKSLPRCAVTA